MEKELTIRGNKTIKLVEYFESVASAEINEEVVHNQENFNYIIKGLNWEVKVTREKEILIGRMTFPEVIVTINAVDHMIEEFIYWFRIEFLSAGG